LRSLSNEPLLILAALVTVYIVLGVLYESYIHPITILSTLPSAGVGAILALLLCRTEFSIIALIGIILLIGIVKKNAIMMIDFAIEAERALGLAPAEAIEKACLLRFRPIMMTTLAALLGGLPLAITHGAGAELRQPLGPGVPTSVSRSGRARGRHRYTRDGDLGDAAPRLWLPRRGTGRGERDAAPGRHRSAPHRRAPRHRDERLRVGAERRRARVAR